MADFDLYLKRRLKRRYDPVKQGFNNYGVTQIRSRPKTEEVIKQAGLVVKPTPKTEEVIKQAGLIVKPTIAKQDKTFKKPVTQDEWLKFHKTNEEGMDKAYKSKEGYHIDGNKLFIAGTRDIQDVMDWPKIPLGMFQYSKIYKNVEPVFKDNPQIDYVVGHSAGGSATLELEKRYPERNITSVTYNAPVFEKGSSDPMDWITDDNKPLRFATAWDPVTSLDYNARVTYKAPDINLDLAKNVAKVYTSPSAENISNVIQSGVPDPLMGQHSMQGTYSNPSSATDFITSGVKAVAASNTLAAAAL